MRCEVCVSGAGGVKSVSEGELELRENGFDLDYTISGDRCALSVRGTTLTQSRRGNVDMDITLSAGNRTVCMLLSGELTGEVPVRTVSLTATADNKFAEVSARYFLGGAEIFLGVTARVL